MSWNEAFETVELAHGYVLEVYQDYDPMPPTDWIEGLEVVDISGWSHETERVLDSVRPGLYELYSSRGWEGVERWGRMAGYYFEAMPTPPSGAPVLIHGPESIADDMPTVLAWLRGDVYGVVLTSPDGEIADSCWGFYNYPGIGHIIGEWHMTALVHQRKKQREAAELAEYMLDASRGIG